MFTESDIQRYQCTIDRALAFLRANEDEILRMDDLSAHYKALYLYASSDDRVLSRRYLDLVVSRYLRHSGDFRTSETDKGWNHLRNSPANRYIYSNGWMIVGLRRMAAYGVAARALKFVMRFQSPELGGFCSRYDIEKDDVNPRYLDTSSTSSGGLALLACGRIDEAIRAGDFVLRLLAAQPDMNRNYFSSWDVEGGLMTELGDGEDLDSIRGRKQYCLSAEKDALREQVWMTGKPMMFLARLFDATGDERYLAGAERLFDYFHKLGESRWQNPACCKTMWGGSELYRLTGQEKYGETVKRMLDGFHQTQCEWGGWIHTMRYTSREDQPLAATVDLVQEFCGEIRDAMFNVTGCKASRPATGKADLTQTISLADIVGIAEQTCTGPVDPKQTALLIVDMQGAADDPMSELEKRALASTERLLQTVRGNGVRVVHVILGCWTLDGSDLEPFMQIERQVAGANGIDSYLNKQTWDSPRQQIHPSLSPIRGELVLKKTSASAFATTGLATLLRNMRIRDLVVCGKQTDGCCGFTAVEAASQGFLVTMVEDACSARTHAGHLAMLRIIQQHVGRVCCVEEMIRDLTTRDGGSTLAPLGPPVCDSR